MASAIGILILEASNLFNRIHPGQDHTIAGQQKAFLITWITGDPDQCTNKLELPRFVSIHDIKDDYKDLVKRALGLSNNQC